jgi:hypothetical protein
MPKHKLHEQTHPTEDQNQIRSEKKQTGLIIVAVLLLILFLAGVVFAVIAMSKNPAQTENIRDIVIIFLALESFIIGLSLIILIVQLARLTALLQEEVQPILDSTNETVSTLRGTTAFLSNNLVRPVMKFSSMISALRHGVGSIGSMRAKTNEEHGGRAENV